VCLLEGGGEATDDGGPRSEIRGTGTPPTMREDGGGAEGGGISDSWNHTQNAGYNTCIL
jgi:hypothetical protein